MVNMHLQKESLPNNSGLICIRVLNSAQIPLEKLSIASYLCHQPCWEQVVL